MSENKQYLIKGDVSGIQEFIFNVASKKAAKTLKARSYYVEQVTCEALDYFGIPINKQEQNKDIIYNGGGNFYIIYNKEDFHEVIRNAESQINQKIAANGLYLTIESSIYEPKKFGDAWKEVNKKVNIKKLKKFQDDFKTYQETKNFEIPENQNNLKFWNENLRKENSDWLDKLYEKDDSQRHQETSDKSIINLQQMAKFAELRTGTGKIGILKMDVDNLSKQFENFKNEKDAKLLSNQMDNFFLPKYANEKLNLFNIIENEIVSFPTKEEINKHKVEFRNKMKYNIYPVFAGGDDCFIIGAWDAVAQIAQEIHKRFMEYMKSISHENITLSASLQFVESHYPVIRFAENAESDLHQAKSERKINNIKIEKNAICFLGEIITWGEYYKNELSIISLKNSLLEIIKLEDKSQMLHRIQQSAVDYNILQNKALQGKMNLPEIWKLYHYLRNVKDETLRKNIETKIVAKYEKALLSAYINEFTTNPVVFPLAARWVELIS